MPGDVQVLSALPDIGANADLPQVKSPLLLMDDIVPGRTARSLPVSLTDGRQDHVARVTYSSRLVISAFREMSFVRQEEEARRGQQSLQVLPAIDPRVLALSARCSVAGLPDPAPPGEGHACPGRRLRRTGEGRGGWRPLQASAGLDRSLSREHVAPGAPTAEADAGNCRPRGIA